MTRLALSSLCVFACSGGGSSNPPDASLPTFPNKCVEIACATGPTFAAASDIVSYVATKDWTDLGPDTSGCLPASPDLAVTGTVTVQGSAITPPAACATACGPVMFELVDTPPGVTCLQPDPLFDYTLCGAITLQDTTVRLRVTVRETHPSQYNLRPVVQVLPACATACPSTELACEPAHTCWSNVRDHCAYCLGGTDEECACWDGAQFMSDGTSCSFFISADSITLGTCHAGVCKAN